MVSLVFSHSVTYPFCADPGISSCVEELFEVLSFNTGCHASLHSSIVPMALEILTSVPSQLPLGLVAVCASTIFHFAATTALCVHAGSA